MDVHMTTRTDRLVIKNGRVLLATRTLLLADVSIVDGRIAEIGVDLSGEQQTKTKTALEFFAQELE